MRNLLIITAINAVCILILDAGCNEGRMTLSAISNARAAGTELSQSIARIAASPLR